MFGALQISTFFKQHNQFAAANFLSILWLLIIVMYDHLVRPFTRN